MGDSDRTGQVAVTSEQFMWFVDTALDQMAAIVRDLGNDLANERPALHGANSPFAILTHCLGVMEYWGGATVAERAVTRDRGAEFTATGSVAVLLVRASAARRKLEEDINDLDSLAPPANVPGEPVPYCEAKGAVLLHILEELYQHLGQMELSRDVLVGNG
jgi:hypothetical protein